MRRRFLVVTVPFDTETSKSFTEDLVQHFYDKIYGAGKIKFEYNLLAEDEVELHWERCYDYMLSGKDFITDFDMDLVMHLGLENFRPEPLGNPVLGPLVPMGNNFYAPTTSFADFYKKMLEKTGESVKKVDVIADNRGVTVTIKYK